VIEDDAGTQCYRLAALIDVSGHAPEEREALQQQLREKDTQLWEIQHRVKNNLQMITALIGLEARQARGKMDTTPFDRLSGRIASIQILYSLLSNHTGAENIDLGMYLSGIAASVLQAHSTPGIRLDLQVDSFVVSVNVALPAGLVVNELLTNSLKHAFAGRDGGIISLRSRLENNECRLIIADDGVGLPPGLIWPERTKLSAAIVQTLRVNAKAELTVDSQPGQGTKVTITFPVAAGS
jgi:two-component sensor histidine kinase